MENGNMLTSVDHHSIVTALTLKNFAFFQQRKDLKAKKMFNLVIDPADEIYIPQAHCRQCHYTSWITRPKAPTQCLNRNGYTDTQNVIHPKCPHPRQWYVWPESFDIQTCECELCRVIWRMEQERLRLFQKQPAVAKKRGPRFKYQKD
jgi:hypothetical protein